MKDCLRTLKRQARLAQISSTKTEAALQPQPSKSLCLVLGLLSVTACFVISKSQSGLALSTYRRDGACKEP